MVKATDGFKVKQELHQQTAQSLLLSGLMDKLGYNIRQESLRITMFMDKVVRQQFDETLIWIEV